jgi:hypothetical protein
MPVKNNEFINSSTYILCECLLAFNACNLSPVLSECSLPYVSLPLAEINYTSKFVIRHTLRHLTLPKVHTTVNGLLTLLYLLLNLRNLHPIHPRIQNPLTSTNNPHGNSTQDKQANPLPSIQQRKDRIRIETIMGVTKLDPEPICKSKSSAKRQSDKRRLGVDGGSGPGGAEQQGVGGEQQRGEQVERQVVEEGEHG